MENAICVQGLSKSYSGFSLQDVSFCVPSGSIVGFIGENGAGKSTTIKAILELIHRDAGEISLLGQKNGAELSEVKEQIGVVFDESCLPENLKLTEVDTLMGRIFRHWEKEKFLEYCRRFELPSEKRIKDYSRGMKMKLSIAVALSHKTKLLILDEATSGLDPVVRDEILDIFLEFIQEDEHTVFLSSHITSDIEKIADYILLIHKGRVLLYENKDVLLEEYGMVRCTPAQAERIGKELTAGIRRNQFETEILVRKKEAFMKDPELVVDRVTLEDILLFTVKYGVEEERR